MSNRQQNNQRKKALLDSGNFKRIMRIYVRCAKPKSRWLRNKPTEPDIS